MKAGLCTLTATHWDGDLPLPGQYVKSVRGRTAFLIVEIKPAPASARYAAKFICERHRAERLGVQDVVHAWQWASR